MVPSSETSSSNARNGSHLVEWLAKGTPQKISRHSQGTAKVTGYALQTVKPYYWTLTSQAGAELQPSPYSLVFLCTLPQGNASHQPAANLMWYADTTVAQIHCENNQLTTLIGCKPTPWNGARAWHCSGGQEPQKPMDPRGKWFYCFIVMLKVHSNKMTQHYAIPTDQCLTQTPPKKPCTVGVYYQSTPQRATCRGFETLSPKWDVFIKLLSSGLRDL